MLLPGKLTCCAPLIVIIPPSENPESWRKKFGDDILPTGFPLLIILKTLLTRRLKLIVCAGGFLFVLSSLKPKDLEMEELKTIFLEPLPRFRGISLSVGEGFGSRTPYFVAIKSGLLKSVANAGRSLKNPSPLVSRPVKILNLVPELIEKSVPTEIL